jgi:hypothetical protein
MDFTKKFLSLSLVPIFFRIIPYNEKKNQKIISYNLKQGKHLKKNKKHKFILENKCFYGLILTNNIVSKSITLTFSKFTILE